MPGRKPRILSQEELALWHKVARTAKKLSLETYPQETEQKSLRRQTVTAERTDRPMMALPAETRVKFDLTPDPVSSLSHVHPQMDRRSFERLRRGKLAPEARLDLHGMTSARAQVALTSFILDAHASGLRLVLVITGKGRPGEQGTDIPERHGILRHSLPHWLSAPPLSSRVLQVTSAHQRHGGGGAFYVYLRRQRPG